MLNDPLKLFQIWKTRTFLIVVKPVVHVHNYKDLMYITLPERVKVRDTHIFLKLSCLCHLNNQNSSLKKIE